ncbi:hypothetical protein D1007_33479 [Hordeum vulgare]|nr:hypothetical protein D1007_33479 [Hordeum vulgare]
MKEGFEHHVRRSSSGFSCEGRGWWVSTRSGIALTPLEVHANDDNDDYDIDEQFYAESGTQGGVDGPNGNDEHVGDLDFDLDIGYDEYQQETLDRHWYIIMPSDIYAYWGIAPPQAPVPELTVEYQTTVYQWEPEELTQQWHP